MGLLCNLKILGLGQESQDHSLNSSYQVLWKGTQSWLNGQDRNVTQSARPLVREIAGTDNQCQWLRLSACESDSNCQSTRTVGRLICQLQVDNWAIWPWNYFQAEGSSYCSWQVVIKHTAFYGPPAKLDILGPLTRATRPLFELPSLVLGNMIIANWSMCGWDSAEFFQEVLDFFK